MDSEGLGSLPKFTTLKNRRCSKCGKELCFRVVDEFTPVCVVCENLELLDSESHDSKIKEINSNITTLKNKRNQLLSRYSQSSIIAWINQLLFDWPRYMIQDSHINSTSIIALIELIRLTYQNSSPQGSNIVKEIFKSIISLTLQIKGLESLKGDLEHELIYIDSNNFRYRPYKFMRMLDGLGEYNIAPYSSINKFLDANKDNYSKSLKKYEEEGLSDIFQGFQERESESINFYRSFFVGIQSKQEWKQTLSLDRVKTLDIDIQNLRSWRLAEFPVGVFSKSIIETQKSLQSQFGMEKATAIMENLIASPENINSIPYGISIKGKVTFPPFWTLLLELLFVAIKEEETFQDHHQTSTESFEKIQVPEILQSLGYKTRDGHIETDEQGNQLFEIDQYVLQGDTLWVVEITSRLIPRRFLESYDSLREKHREKVDRPGKRKTYPEIITYIRNNLSALQQQNKVPIDWKIDQVEGLIVYRLPPLEDEYRGIFLCWYRDLMEFYNLREKTRRKSFFHQCIIRLKGIHKLLV